MLLTATHDLHNHFFGNISAEQLWQLGAKRHRLPEICQRLDWYEEEYNRLTGKQITWRDYWNSEAGFELLEQNFNFTTGANFNEFQAKFNLIIALAPIKAQHLELVTEVLTTHANDGLKHVEYRLPIPPHFQPEEIPVYLSYIANRFGEYSETNFTPSFAVSLSRNPEQALEHYSIIKKWQIDNKNHLNSNLLTAIDFCGFEYGNPPCKMQNLFGKVNQDNRKNPDTALAILYHVGEMYEDKSQASAIRWIHQAAQFGVHRLGHCLALGVDPQLPKRTVVESSAEYQAHIKWLKHMGWEDLNPECEVGVCGNNVTHVSGEESYAKTRELQSRVMQELASTSVVVECCPTSNLIIGNLNPIAHPLKRFLDANLKVTIGSDDPGIFKTSLQNEIDICLKSLSIESQRIKTALDQTHLFTSQQLATTS